MTNRSPRLFSHLVRNSGSRTLEVSPTITSESPSEQVLGVWAERDPDFDDDVLAHPFNCWTVLGIAIVITTSGAFWTGVGLLINHFLK